MSAEAFLFSTGVVVLGEMGDKVVKWVPISWVLRVAALLFATIGLAMPLGAGS